MEWCHWVLAARRRLFYLFPCHLLPDAVLHQEADEVGKSLKRRSTRHPRSTDHRFDAERAYLLNVAESIQQCLLAQLTGEAHARGLDCIHIVLRVAAALDNGAIASDPDRRLSVAEESHAWNHANRVFADLLDGVMQFRAPPRRVLEIAEVEAYLRQHPLGGAGVRVLETRALSGGRSKLTSVIRQAGAAELPTEVVIRQDWNTLAGSSVQSEFGLLRVLWEYGIKVAKPLNLEPKAGLLGAPFIMVERVTGAPNGSLLTPPDDEVLILNAADELGRIHALGDAPFRGLLEIAERNANETQLVESLQSFRAVIDVQHRPHSTLLGEALEYLEQTVGRITRSRTLVHGDFGFHNLLFVGQEVAAVLDWELSYLGHPAYDLGYIKSVATQRISWDRFMNRYRASGGLAFDSFTISWFALFASLWLYHVLLKARAGVMAGVLHDIEITGVCAHIGPMLLLQIAAALAELRDG